MPNEEKNVFQDVALEHSGTKITLPSIPRPMTTQEAREALYEIEQDLETEVMLNHEIECFPLDGAVAFARALLKRYGHPIGTKTPPKHMFDSAKPPTLVTVPISATEKIQVPWGSVKVPNMTGRFETMTPGNPASGPKFIIGGEILKKHEKESQAIAALTEELLASNSIYKGKAIRVSFEYIRDERPFDPSLDSPTFIDTSKVRPESLIFPDETAKLIEQGLFTPIKSADSFRQYGIPLKRGVLLTGPYGCGKTLTANVTAKLCEDNGWTFLYLKDVRDLVLALKYAKLYSPCVIFAEDVDKAVGHDRSNEVNAILNTLDGVDYKDQEILTIVTTNHAENISKAMLRPGRLDTVVPVLPPDQSAAERLIRFYGGKLLSPDIDISAAAKALQGHIPATIRECVDRSKSIVIARELAEHGKAEIEGKVTAQDLQDSLAGMKPHMELMEGAKANGPSMMEAGLNAFGQAVGAGVGLAIHSQMNGLGKAVTLPPELMGLLTGRAMQGWTQPGTGFTPAEGESAEEPAEASAEA
tara:strand:- start:70548 stop:72134 length:1587 start_codon:yes stop_codon:yes gene_type:complete